MNHANGSCRPSMANPCQRSARLAFVNIIGDTVAVGIDGHALPRFIHERRFSFQWSAKRPLSDDLKIHEKKRQQSYGDTQIPSICGGDEHRYGATSDANDDGQDMVSLACPIQHVNDSQVELSLLERLSRLQRMHPLHRPFSILFWPYVPLGASPTGRQSYPCSQGVPKCPRLFLPLLARTSPGKP